MTASTESSNSSTSNKIFNVWPGRVLTGLASAVLLGSAAGKLSGQEKMVETFKHLGFADGAMQQIGAVELVCGLLYAVPQTRVLGAILVAAYMGGAVSAHVRLGEPFAAPVLIALIAWAGVWLRSPELRKVLPLWR